nr:hypothetical protein [uncultured Rhodopila sp.]
MTPLSAGSPHIEVGAHQRRAAKRRENATRPGRLAADRPGYRRAQPRGLRPLLGQPAREGADKRAVNLPAKHVKPNEAPIAEARAIILDSALL